MAKKESKIESKKKLSKKQIYIIVAVAVVIVAVGVYLGIMLKAPAIGYQPDIPQEWFDQIEAEKNSPTVKFVRTYDLHGVWRNCSTGEYFNVSNNGSIYKVNSPDDEVDYLDDTWGSVLAEQIIDRKIAENLLLGGGNALAAGDKYTLIINSMYTDIYDVTAEIIDGKTVKSITSEGNELIFERVQEFKAESEINE